VWLASDNKRPAGHPHKLVALKIQKSASHYSDAAIDEIQILKEIESKQKADPQGHRFVVRLLDDFVIFGVNGKHVCLVFETMGKHILHYIKKYNYQGMPLKMVKLITKQILAGLMYLHANCLIIHTDLKPENFLLAPEQPYSLKEVQADRVRLVEERRIALEAAAKEQAAKEAAERGEQPKKLNKNQKKRVKAKQKKEEEKAAQVPTTTAATEEKGEIQENGAEEEEALPAVNIVLPPSADTQAASPLPDSLPASPASIPASPAPTTNGVASLPEGESLSPTETPTITTDNVKRKIRYTCKIADLGNACWTHKHFTDDITTRQYRSPEVICGFPYDTPVDVFSLACMTFELLTGDYLFDPKEDRKQRHSRDEDHLALMMELLGRMPKKLTTQGKFAKEIFDKKGGLRHIQKLDDWGLRNVLIEKYKIAVRHADAISSFLLPCLALDPLKRATAQEAYNHPWLADIDIDGEITDDEEDPLRAYGQEDLALQEEKNDRPEHRNAVSVSGDEDEGEHDGEEDDQGDQPAVAWQTDPDMC